MSFNCRASLASSPSTHRALQFSSPRVAEKGLLKDMLSLSPKGSCHFDPCCAEIMKEISTLEAEIMQLEGYLLSLYRRAFERLLPTLSDNPKTPFECKRGLPNKDLDTSPAQWGNRSNHQVYAATPKPTYPKSGDPEHCSLAEHLGVSPIVDTRRTPDRLSEEIVRCISSIYSKLGDTTSAHDGSVSSSNSSFSTSITFSPRNSYDGGSSRYNKGNGSYAPTIQVLKIRLDENSFDYAATMLNKYRSMIQSLENVDPRKMSHEEKLVFWINIHNAVVMHAYLAYGTRNLVKYSSILKASYNVGGHCINANEIQSSILRIQSHFYTLWPQALFSQGKKFRNGNAKHIYAIETTEPLVHFALSSGAYSDPAVRVYTAKTVMQDLKLAKEDFIQSSVYIDNETKVCLPKILYYFAKDTSLSTPGILEVVHECLYPVQQRAIQSCLAKGRVDKCVHWLPQNSTFRYVIHREFHSEA